MSETSATDPLFLSLSLDGALSKWSLADNRCLQAMSSTTSDKTRPQGMILVPHSGVGEGRLTDSLILVYGCNTEIVVLNAESLETIFVWPGHVDWPIPVVVERRRESTARECELLTILSNGQVQSWVMTGKREKLSASVLEVSKREDLSWSVKTREDWGRVRWWQKLVGGYLVVQSRGFSFHVAVPATESGFILKSEVGVEEGITGVEVGTALKTVIIKTDVGTVKIYRLRKDELELLAVSTPADFLKDERIMSVVAFFDATTGKGKIAISSRPKVRTAVCGNPSGLDISITEIARDNRQLDITTWNQKGVHLVDFMCFVNACELILPRSSHKVDQKILWISM